MNTPEARKHRAQWAANRRRMIAYGRWAPTEQLDPAPVRAHIANLREFGLSHQSIAHMAGEHPSALSTLTQPNNLAYAKYITAERAERILAVRFSLDAIPDDSRVNNAGTRRRIEALMFNGWTLRYLGQRLGVTPQAVHGYRTRAGLTAANARAVRDLYDELWDKQGPSVRVRNLAKRSGWLPAAAWDENDLDDPSAQPADAGEQGHGSLVDNIEFILEHEPYATTVRLTERLGYTHKTAISNALKRAGRADLLAQLARNAEVSA